MNKYILMLPYRAILKKYHFYPESMKNVRSYFGYKQKSVVFSNLTIYERFGLKDFRNMYVKA